MIELIDFENRMSSIRKNPWNAYTAFLEKRAFDSFRVSQDTPPILPLTIAVKDNIAIENERLTCGSRILRNFVSPYTATAVQRLDNAGAIIVAKTNMDEFGMGSSSEYSAFGPVINPLSTKLSPGGSSGGSAAAVAAGDVDGALGSDTGGSVRQPAAFCGIIGLRPTYGAISRSGLVAFCSSFDQIGPMARKTDIVRQIYNVCSGFDENDMTSRRTQNSVNDSRFPLRFGTVTNVEKLIETDVIRLTLDNVKSHFLAEGFDHTSVFMPDLQQSLAAYHVLSSAEAASNLARFDGMRYGDPPTNNLNLHSFFKVISKNRSKGFGKEVKRRIMMGSLVLQHGFDSNIYNNARRYRDYVRQHAIKLFKAIDFLLLPTTPTLPFETGTYEKRATQMHKADIFTVFASLAGCPALSLPIHGSASPVPASVQLIAGHGKEEVLFEISQMLENSWAS